MGHCLNLYLTNLIVILIGLFVNCKILFLNVLTVKISKGDKKYPKQRYAKLFLVATDLNE